MALRMARGSQISQILGVCFNFWPDHNYKIISSNSELPSTCSTITHCPTKAPRQAKAKQQSGHPTFTHVKEESCEDRSVYNDSSEEIWSDEDEDPDDQEDSLECIASFKRLYSVFLPPQLKQKHPASRCFCINFSNKFVVRSTSQKIQGIQSVLSIKRTPIQVTGGRGSIGARHQKAVKRWTHSFCWALKLQRQKVKTNQDAESHTKKMCLLPIPWFTTHIRDWSESEIMAEENLTSWRRILDMLLLLRWVLDLMKFVWSNWRQNC